MLTLKELFSFFLKESNYKHIFKPQGWSFPHFLLTPGDQWEQSMKAHCFFFSYIYSDIDLKLNSDSLEYLIT